MLPIPDLKIKGSNIILQDLYQLQQIFDCLDDDLNTIQIKNYTDSKFLLPKFPEYMCVTDAIEQVNELIQLYNTVATQNKQMIEHVNVIKNETSSSYQLLLAEIKHYKALQSLKQQIETEKTNLLSIKNQCDVLGITNLVDTNALGSTDKEGVTALLNLVTKYLFPIHLLKSSDKESVLLMETSDTIDLQTIQTGDKQVQMLPYNTLFLVSTVSQLELLKREINTALEKQKRKVDTCAKNFLYYQVLADELLIHDKKSVCRFCLNQPIEFVYVECGHTVCRKCKAESVCGICQKEVTNCVELIT